MKLPSNILWNRKIIYIKRFDVYITGCSTEQLESIRDRKVVSDQSRNSIQSIVDIHVKGNTKSVKTLYFSFNGICGSTQIEPSLESTTRITLRVNGTVFTKEIGNKNLANQIEPDYSYWPDFNGIELLVDIDQNRLSESSKNRRTDHSLKYPDAISLVNALQSDILMKDEQIFQLERELTELNLKVVQEEHKTKREEIRYHGTIADQRTAVVVDSIKIGLALLGVLSLIVNIMIKNKIPSTQKNLVEWAIPNIFNKNIHTTR